MNRHVALVAVITTPLFFVGCTQDKQTADVFEQASPVGDVGVDGSQFLLASEPEGAVDVIKNREVASDGDDIVIVGRIGGSANPWIDGWAAFSIVDESLKACSDIEGDNCPKPWDYCCETEKLPNATALVKIVDDQGELIKVDAKGLLNISELSTVVVEGKAKRDDAGNLTVLGSKLYVRKN